MTVGDGDHPKSRRHECLGELSERPPEHSVLLVTPRWARDGGVAAHVMASATVLARHGVEVHVLVAKIDSASRPSGVNVHHSPELCDPRAPIRARLGAAPKTSVVHLHQLEDPELVEAFGADAPVLISVHGYSACTSGVHYFRPGHECTRPHGAGCLPRLVAPGCAHTRHPRNLPSKYLQATRGLEALKRADLVISYSSAVDRHLAVNGVVRRRVVPLFTTMVARSGSGHAARRRVVFAARIAAPKGLDVLIRAARNVEGEFVICGEGWRLGAMRKLAERRGVVDRISFRGWLDPERLAQELADASVVVMPSIWPEPFGLVGIEALACGRPVVASCAGGVLDWLEDGVTGLCVRPGDASELARALNDLLADPQRQRAMGIAGRRMVRERFSPERHLAALMECYLAAHSESRAQRPLQPLGVAA
jgi:glycosyltransferase involved in cell wall biosynthesis